MRGRGKFSGNYTFSKIQFRAEAFKREEPDRESLPVQVCVLESANNDAAKQVFDISPLGNSDPELIMEKYYLFVARHFSLDHFI